MSNILESKYDVTMSYDDGDVVRYEGRLRMMYHGRSHDFPDGITDADAMLHYCRMKEAGMTPAIKNSGARPLQSKNVRPLPIKKAAKRAFFTPSRGLKYILGTSYTPSVKKLLKRAFLFFG